MNHNRILAITLQIDILKKKLPTHSNQSNPIQLSQGKLNPIQTIPTSPKQYLAPFYSTLTQPNHSQSNLIQFNQTYSYPT